MSTKPQRLDITIQQGATWADSLQWMQERKTYKVISAAPQLVPVRLTVTGHGVPDGWPVFISGVAGAVELNSPDPAEPYTAALIDANTVELVNVNGEDFGTFTSGGYLEYYTPYDLSTYTEATLIIRASQGSATVLDTLTKTGGQITFDNTLKLINYGRTSTLTAGYVWVSDAWYDLDLTHSSGRIDRVSYGIARLQLK